MSLAGDPTKAALERLCEESYELLDLSLPEQAERRVIEALRLFDELNLDSDLRIVAMLAGSLVDVGTASKNQKLVGQGVELFSNPGLREYLGPPVVEYNLGNAKKGLYDIERGNANHAYNLESMALLTEAKNHYWRALQDLPPETDLSPQVCVNLANTLNQASRVVEALHWYQSALTLDPDFGMAWANRGDALMYLGNLSGAYSISLVVEARRCFDRAVGSKSTLPFVATVAAQKREMLEDYLSEHHQWSEDAHKADEAETAEEAQKHSVYWNYCLDNFLVLSEHALYCRCAGARRDDLSIPTIAPIPGDFVPKCELLLNRVKSEYCLARMLFYEGRAEYSMVEFDDDREGTYTELWEMEAIGMRSEFLRTSFRLCFGILDRLAQGVNELFSVGAPGEFLYFDSFWRPRSKGGEERWNKLNKLQSFGLMALYSVATDLNRKQGEFGHLKETRNFLEHGLLVLLEDDAEELPPDSRPDRIEARVMGRAHFEVLCLRLLQITASAIYSFVFTARSEARKLNSEGPSLTFEISKKSLGKE